MNQTNLFVTFKKIKLNTTQLPGYGVLVYMNVPYMRKLIQEIYCKKVIRLREMYTVNRSKQLAAK